MGSRKRRRNRQDRDTPLQAEITAPEPAVDPEVLARPSPLDLVRRVMIQITVVVTLLVGGAVLTIVGVVISLKSGGTKGAVMSVIGLVMLVLARFLMRGGGLRWALRGVRVTGRVENDDARP